MRGAILGNGLIALLAREILGVDWTLMPFGRSRFYSYQPSLAEDHIIYDRRFDKILNLNPSPKMFSRAFSLDGKLIKTPDKTLLKAWLDKTFQSYDDVLIIYYTNNFNVAQLSIKASELYSKLRSKYENELKVQLQKGPVKSVGNHQITRNQIEDYDMILSTIPLPALLKLCGLSMNLKSKPVQILDVVTDQLNFEGADQVLVVEEQLDFFRVERIEANRYTFYFHNELARPAQYLLNVLGRFEILNGTRVDDYLPLGDVPELSLLSKLGIRCCGTYAEWNWTKDVGSSLLTIKDLLKKT